MEAVFIGIGAACFVAGVFVGAILKAVADGDMTRYYRKR